MIAKSLSLDDVIEKLNGFLKVDRDGISDLFLNKKAVCNNALANHPTVQVWGDETGFSVGILGVLNGLFGTFDDGSKQGWGALMIIVDDSKIIRFGKLENKPSKYDEGKTKNAKN